MRRYLPLFCFMIVLACGQLSSAQAVQWQSLHGTSRYKASFDEYSVRLAPSGRIELWLRFIPKGENERKSAAAEFKEKRYRSHLEYYEIDCSDQTARLGLIDIMGTSRTRLKRLHGSTQADPILPGSLLESVAEHICPVLDLGVEEPEETKTDGKNDDPITLNSTLTSDKIEQIEYLRKKTAKKEAGAEAWRELGNAYFETDQPKLAVMAYQKVLDIIPDDIDTLNDQGSMYRQNGDFLPAVANFEKAFSLNPENLESLFNAAYVYAFDLNNFPKALGLWRKYVEKESAPETAVQVQSFIDQYEK